MEGTAFFEPHGWTEAAYVDLFLDAASFGRESVSGRALRVLMPLLPAKVRANLKRGLGVARLERSDGTVAGSE